MSLPRWEYFLSIESDLELASRFVDFTPDNFKTYSIHFARIIMAAGAEIDSVAKELCLSIDHNSKASKILQYYPIISSIFPRFSSQQIDMERFKIIVKPWEDWSSTNSPKWWSKSFNKIKHNRDTHFHEANLENAILACAGLFSMLLFLYHHTTNGNYIISAFEGPKIFGTPEAQGGSNLICRFMLNV